MKTLFNLVGLPNPEGETNSSALLKSIKTMMAERNDEPSLAIVAGKLKELIQSRAHKVLWPANSIEEDVIQNVLEELVCKTIPRDIPLGKLIARNGNEKLVIQRLNKLIRLRLEARLLDQTKSRKWQNTVLGHDFTLIAAEEPEKYKIPEKSDVLRSLQNLEKLPAASKKDCAIVARILETGKTNVSQAAAQAGITEDKARRAILRIRPHLRQAFEMD